MYAFIFLQKILVHRGFYVILTHTRYLGFQRRRQDSIVGSFDRICRADFEIIIIILLIICILITYYLNCSQEHISYTLIACSRGILYLHMTCGREFIVLHRIPFMFQ